jgi:hypothetical protein
VASDIQPRVHRGATFDYPVTFKAMFIAPK